MKKLKRILISVCVVAMLMGCLSVSAFAAVTGFTNEYLVYQIEGGDTMINLCKAAGVDFASNYPWIMAVNNITDFSQIKAGQSIYLPRFDTSKNTDLANQLIIMLNPNSKAATLATMMGATAPTVTTPITTTVTVPVTTTVTTGTSMADVAAQNVQAAVTGTTTTVPVATTTAAVVAAPVAVAAQAGDTVVSYLVNHVMRSGETVGSVCAALGVDFAANQDQIKKLSNITSWNKIPVGKTVVIPSLVAPAGSSFTAIVAHRVIGGETVSSICAKFGLNFGKVQEQLKALNKTENLNVIRVGQVFYVPVPGAAAVGATTIATAGTTVTTATSMADAAAQNVQAAVTGTTPAAATTSAMAAGTSAHGSFVLQVNGQPVSSATSGQTVTIVAMPEAGYKVNSVTVLKDNGTASVPVNGMSFVMPNSAISVNVTFKKA